MNQTDEVIHEESFSLGDYFQHVRDKIENDPLFGQTSRLCEFKDGKLFYRTEYIHPTVNPGMRFPVMLLFSNPHPVSVSRGMFLSEPRSLTFWRRLFECELLDLTPLLDSALKTWSETTVIILKDHLVNVLYGGEILIHMDCLESLPTNQFIDLDELFPGTAGRDYRRQVMQTTSIQRMIQAYRNQRCKHWIVFSAAAYREILRDKSLAMNGPRRICEALNKWLQIRNEDLFWQDLEDFKKSIVIEGETVNLYLPLIARLKHWKATNGQFYFTLMLDRIFKRIRNNDNSKPII